MDIKGKKVLVIGMGASGRAATKLLIAHGALVHSYDGNPNLNYSPPKDVTAFDLVVVSPGIPSSDSVLHSVFQNKIPWMGEAELALQFLQDHQKIGITGTNGKTTVTMLITHILNFSGKKAFSLGNIGKPLSQFALEPKEGILVIELSSYQIDGMFSRSLDVGIVLNVSPDHLDRYGTFDAYKKSKYRIQELTKEGGLVQLEGFVGENFEEKNQDAAKKVTTIFGVGDEIFERGLKTFQKPPHRLAFVENIEGVSFYNDSKGTNIDAVIKAVESFSQPVILIAGGKEKGTGYRDWILPFQGKVKGIFLIGEAAQNMAKDLEGVCPLQFSETLERATKEAFLFSKAGDIVLLSPGCSSFDQFKNFEERGEKFEEIVINRLTTIAK